MVPNVNFIYSVRASSAQRGFSLLEVLISILLLTIGALGAAGMQITGLKDAGSATGRYRAASLLTTMSDTLTVPVMFPHFQREFVTPFQPLQSQNGRTKSTASFLVEKEALL
jgi:type IV pilus modification protein PilV